MEFELGQRVHLVIDKYDGDLTIPAERCGTVRGIFWSSYLVQLDGDSFETMILGADLAPGCPNDV